MFITDFRKTDFNGLSQLPPNMPPQWGSMTLQHMVEHLIYTFKICNGGMTVAVYTSADKIQRIKDISLFSEREFPRDVKMPILPEHPAPYEYISMQEAIKTLQAEIEKFEQHFEEHKGLTNNHPLFGPLVYDEWVRYHNKHFTHHLKQFDLLQYGYSS